MMGDFPVISDHERQTPSRLAEAEVGSPVLLEAPMYAPTPGSEDPFDYAWRVGDLKLVAVRTDRGVVRCSIVFRFDDGAQALAMAELPLEGESVGSGEFVLTGGSNRFMERRDKLPVTVQNPKRWG